MRPGSVKMRAHLAAHAVFRRPASMLKDGTLEPRPYSLGCLSLRNPVRFLCMWIILNPWFDRLVLLTIVANTIVLGFTDPLDVNDVSWRNQMVNFSQPIFTALFALEALIKIVALDLVGPNSYLSDRGHVFDAIVVLTGIISLIPGADRVAAVRVLRALRPLRALNAVSGLRVVINAIGYSLSSLFSIGLLLIMGVFVFAMLGLEIWMGVMRGQCMYTDADSGQRIATGIPCALPCSAVPGAVCTPTYGDACNVYNTVVETTDATSGAVIKTLASHNTTCEVGENPDYGYTGFDNIGLAFLTSYTIVTQEGWFTKMQNLWHTWGLTPLVSFMFVLFIVLTAWFILQLALAAVVEAYERALADEKVARKHALERKERLRAHTNVVARQSVWAGAGGPGGSGAGAAAKARPPFVVEDASNPQRHQRPPVSRGGAQRHDSDDGGGIATGMPATAAAGAASAASPLDVAVAFAEPADSSSGAGADIAATSSDASSSSADAGSGVFPAAAPTLASGTSAPGLASLRTGSGAINSSSTRGAGGPAAGGGRAARASFMAVPVDSRMLAAAMSPTAAGGGAPLFPEDGSGVTSGASAVNNPLRTGSGARSPASASRSPASSVGASARTSAPTTFVSPLAAAAAASAAGGSVAHADSGSAGALAVSSGPPLRAHVVNNPLGSSRSIGIDEGNESDSDTEPVVPFDDHGDVAAAGIHKHARSPTASRTLSSSSASSASSAASRPLSVAALRFADLAETVALQLASPASGHGGGNGSFKLSKDWRHKGEPGGSDRQMEAGAAGSGRGGAALGMPSPGSGQSMAAAASGEGAPGDRSSSGSSTTTSSGVTGAVPSRAGSVRSAALSASSDVVVTNPAAAAAARAAVEGGSAEAGSTSFVVPGYVSPPSTAHTTPLTLSTSGTGMVELTSLQSRRLSPASYAVGSRDREVVLNPMTAATAAADAAAAASAGDAAAPPAGRSKSGGRSQRLSRVSLAAEGAAAPAAGTPQVALNPLASQLLKDAEQDDELKRAIKDAFPDAAGGSSRRRRGCCACCGGWWATLCCGMACCSSASTCPAASCCGADGGSGDRHRHDSAIMTSFATAANNAKNGCGKRVKHTLKRMWFSLPSVPTPLADACWCFTTHPAFLTLMMFVVIADSVTIAAEYEGMSTEYARNLQLADAVFVWFFVLEMVLRLLSLGLTDYFRDPMCLFEGLIAVVSIIDFSLTITQLQDVGGYSAIAALRLLRVLKLARSWEQLRVVLKKLLKSLPAVTNAFVVLCLAVFIAALVGMELFGGKYIDAIANGSLSDTPRLNYNTLWWACVTAFINFTNENWNDLMTAHSAFSGAWAPIYFVACVVVGNYIFVNLFTAILMSNFDMDAGTAAQLKKLQKKKNKSVDKRTCREQWSCQCRRRRRRQSGTLVAPLPPRLAVMARNAATESARRESLLPATDSALHANGGNTAATGSTRRMLTAVMGGPGSDAPVIIAHKNPLQNQQHLRRASYANAAYKHTSTHRRSRVGSVAAMLQNTASSGKLAADGLTRSVGMLEEHHVDGEAEDEPRDHDAGETTASHDQGRHPKLYAPSSGYFREPLETMHEGDNETASRPTSTHASPIKPSRQSLAADARALHHSGVVGSAADAHSDAGHSSAGTTDPPLATIATPVPPARAPSNSSFALKPARSSSFSSRSRHNLPPADEGGDVRLAYDSLHAGRVGDGDSGAGDQERFDNPLAAGDSRRMTMSPTVAALTDPPTPGGRRTKRFSSSMTSASLAAFTPATIVGAHAHAFPSPRMPITSQRVEFEPLSASTSAVTRIHSGSLAAGEFVMPRIDAAATVVGEHGSEVVMNPVRSARRRSVVHPHMGAAVLSPAASGSVATPSSGGPIDFGEAPALTLILDERALRASAGASAGDDLGATVLKALKDQSRVGSSRTLSAGGSLRRLLAAAVTPSATAIGVGTPTTIEFPPGFNRSRRTSAIIAADGIDHLPDLAGSLHIASVRTSQRHMRLPSMARPEGAVVIEVGATDAGSFSDGSRAATLPPPPPAPLRTPRVSAAGRAPPPRTPVAPPRRPSDAPAPLRPPPAVPSQPVRKRLSEAKLQAAFPSSGLGDSSRSLATIGDSSVTTTMAISPPTGGSASGSADPTAVSASLQTTDSSATPDGHLTTAAAAVPLEPLVVAGVSAMQPRSRRSLSCSDAAYQRTGLAASAAAAAAATAASIAAADSSRGAGPSAASRQASRQSMLPLSVANPLAHSDALSGRTMSPEYGAGGTTTRPRLQRPRARNPLHLATSPVTASPATTTGGTPPLPPSQSRDNHFNRFRSSPLTPPLLTTPPAAGAAAAAAPDSSKTMRRRGAVSTGATVRTTRTGRPSEIQIVMQSPIVTANAHASSPAYGAGGSGGKPTQHTNPLSAARAASAGPQPRRSRYHDDDDDDDEDGSDADGDDSDDDRFDSNAGSSLPQRLLRVTVSRDGAVHVTTLEDEEEEEAALADMGALPEYGEGRSGGGRGIAGALMSFMRRDRSSTSASTSAAVTTSSTASSARQLDTEQSGRRLGSFAPAFLGTDGQPKAFSAMDMRLAKLRSRSLSTMAQVLLGAPADGWTDGSGGASAAEGTPSTAREGSPVTTTTAAAPTSVPRIQRRLNRLSELGAMEMPSAESTPSISRNVSRSSGLSLGLMRASSFMQSPAVSAGGTPRPSGILTPHSGGVASPEPSSHSGGSTHTPGGDGTTRGDDGSATPGGAEGTVAVHKPRVDRKMARILKSTRNVRRGAAVMNTRDAAGIMAAAAAELDPEHPANKRCCGLCGVVRGQVAAGRSLFGRLQARNRALGCLPSDNPFRVFVAWLITRRAFDWFMSLAVLMASVNLALNDAKVPSCTGTSDAPGTCWKLAKYLQYSDIALAAVFALEVVFNIVARGLLLSPKAYLRDPWNFLDLFVAVCMIAGVSLADSQTPVIRLLRAFRALRPIKIVSKFPFMRLVVQAIFFSIPRLLDVGLVMLLMMFVMASIGVQTWRGYYYTCNDPSVTDLGSCVGSFNVSITNGLCGYMPTRDLQNSCLLEPYGYAFPRRNDTVQPNFDNIFNALLQTFELQSGENFPGLMLNAVDAVGYHEAPRRDAHPSAAVYFVIAQVLLNMFLLDLFSSVVVRTYEDLRRKSQGAGLLTNAQQAWIDSLQVLLKAKPPKRRAAPSSRFAWVARLRAGAHWIVSSAWFDKVMLSFIGLNMVVMSLKHFGMDETWVHVIDYSNDGFAALFLAEALFKMLGIGVRQYFKSDWNRFDAALVAMSAFTVAFREGAIGLFFRIFRIARVARLLRTSRRFQRMLRTMLFALPSILNISSLLLVNYYMFAIFGMNLFAHVKYNGEVSTDDNFKTFARAMITLFRSSTGELYNTIMHNLMISAPYCEDDSNCGSPFWPPVFFVVFIIAANFIMQRMFVAVTLSAFRGAQQAEQDGGPFRLTDELVDAYRATWQRAAEGEITVDLQGLRNLVRDLPHPLGLAGDPSVTPDVAGNHDKLWRRINNFLNQLAIVPDANGRFHFHAVLQALLAQASNQNPDYVAVHVSGDSSATPAGAAATFTLREIRAAIRLQRAWRARRDAVRKQEMMTTARRNLLAQEQQLQDQLDQHFEGFRGLRVLAASGGGQRAA